MKKELDVYIDILCALRRDCAMTSLSEHIERDCNIIAEHAISKGLPFLTVDLPAIAKELDRALGQCTPWDLSTVRAVHQNFLNDLTSQIVNDDGEYLLLSELFVPAVRSLRQICLYFYKLNLPYTDEQQRTVVDRFVDVEEELSSLRLSHRDPILKRARVLISRVCSRGDRRDLWHDIRPSHGPGAVATGEKRDRKYLTVRFNATLEVEYPFWEYFTTGLNHVAAAYHDWDIRGISVDTGTAKVVLVPKDSRGPRLISCEPVEVQWIQQGLSRALVGEIESHWSTRGKVNFDDQTINQKLALEGSSSFAPGNWSRTFVAPWDTLDMSDASDRVSTTLVRELFGGTSLLKCMLACRSHATVLPQGRGRLLLNKFAPMGSALCFPVEALVFWSLACAVIQLTEGMHSKNIPEVFVYGDDIIVRPRHTRVVMDALEKYSLKWNADKCCTGFLFKESCGTDALMGQKVTPIRFRKRITSKHTASQYVSLVSLASRHYEQGHLATSALIRGYVLKHWPKAHFGALGLPCSSTKECIKENKARGLRVRLNGYQRLEVYSYVPVTRRTKRLSTGWEAGLRSIVEQKPQRVSDWASVELIGLKRGWVEIEPPR